MSNDPYFCKAWYESINFHQQTWQNRAPRGELIQNDHIFTHNQYWSVTVVPYFSFRQLSRENDMWLFPGKGPSQRLGDGNGIFNKWPGKLLIIVPFLGLQFLFLESLSKYACLLVLNRVKAGILKLCPQLQVVFFVTSTLLLSRCHFVIFVEFVESLSYVFNPGWAVWSKAKNAHLLVTKIMSVYFFFYIHLHIWKFTQILAVHQYWTYFVIKKFPPIGPAKLENVETL